MSLSHPHQHQHQHQHQPQPRVVCHVCESEQDWHWAHDLFIAYAASLPIDLGFQGFEAELKQLSHEYAPPWAMLMLALVDGQPKGCCAFRPLPNSDYLNSCEMKRLYVQPQARGLGLGRLLVEHIIQQACLAGYDNMLLDTLNDMEAARALYEEVGFVEIPPYYHSPIVGAHYLRLELSISCNR